mmetsp:Transcript_59896/g.96984  ORF Transcript_59896/g.96984 Transcript_59896/m.96984 type:complete len:316 (-) Transcript_59896:1124-2071(-)
MTASSKFLPASMLCHHHSTKEQPILKRLKRLELLGQDGTTTKRHTNRALRVLELVQVIAKGWHADLQVLALADVEDEILHLAAGLHAVSLQVLPVREDALREGLSTGLLTEGCNEAEGLSDRQVGLDLDERSALARVLLKDAATAQVHAVVNTAHGLLWACDLHQENRLLQRGLGSELRSEAAASSWRHELSCTAVDGIRVKRHIHDVEANATHVLLAERTFLGGPLEGAVHVLLDLVQVLHGLGLINNQVGAVSLRAVAPDLAAGVFVPVVLRLQECVTLLRVSLGSQLAILDALANLVTNRLGSKVDTIVLVG